MRQLVQDLRSGRVETIEVPDPPSGPNEVLVRTTWSLISPGTEQAVSTTASKSLLGKARDRPDQARQVIDKARREGLRPTVAAVRARLDAVLTPGYSSAGVVEAVGPAVSGVRVGDRVGCFGANAAMHAEKVAVPAPLCMPLPADMDDRSGAFGALGAIAAHGVRIADVQAGSVVVVIGLGLVGQLAAQLATAAGARVIGADTDADRVQLANTLGACGGAEVGSAALESLVAQLTDGHGADSLLVAAATKDHGPIRLAADLARDRATISVVGDVGLDIPRRPFYEKELQLRVSRSYGPGRYDRAYEEEGRDYPIGYVRWTERRLVRYFFEEVAAGRVMLDQLVTHEFPIGEADDAYAELSSKGRMAILLRYPPIEDAEPLQRRAVLAPRPVADGRPRVALIGPGLFARSTLLPLLKRADVEIVAVVGTSPAKTVGIADRWGASYAAADPAEVIDDPSIDTLVIATRHDSHADLTTRGLQHGKAVFVEKPLALTHAELEELRPALDDGGRVVVDFNRSVAPATRAVVAHFSARADPLHVSVRVNAGFLPADHWLRDPSRGGGRLIGEGCHFVDLVSTLVASDLTTIQIAPLGTGPSTLPRDSFVLTLAYDDGSVGTIAYVASGDSQMPKERIELIGGGKGAVIDDFRQLALYPSRTGRLGRPRGRQNKGHAELLDQALTFFREGGDPPIPYRRMLETTRATLLAAETLSAGQPATVEV